MNGDVFRHRLAEILHRRLRQSGDALAFPLDRELAEMGLDSMSAIDLVLDLEQAFEITFPDSMLVVDTFRTGATLEAAIRSLAEGGAEHDSDSG